MPLKVPVSAMMKIDSTPMNSIAASSCAPRNGLRSGCYPLDAFYKTLEPEASQLKAIKQRG